MSKLPLCFLSYAGVDTRYMFDVILPLLRQIRMEVWILEEQNDRDKSISELIIEGIKKADFVICLVNSKSIYSHFEIGAALGNSKPILAIEDKKHKIYTFYDQIRYLKLTELNDFVPKLFKEVDALIDNVIDKSTFKLNESNEKKIVGIRVGTQLTNLVEELNFTLEFIQFIQNSTTNPNIELIDTGKGSLKSLISIDLKSWAELLEKIVFFIPELRKRKAERLKIEADILKLNAETRSINVSTDIQQAEAFIDLFEKYTKNGLKVQIDNDLLISQDEKGQLVIKTPHKEIK